MALPGHHGYMDFRGDERAQSVQIGAILLFATLVILASLYQAYVIPQQTASIEFDDYQQASGDMVAARNAVLDTASGGAVHGQTVKTGSTYPSRVFFVNPPPPAGRVYTTQNQSLSLTNVESVGDNANVDSYFTESGRNLTFSTRRLTFDPDYNRIDAADIGVTQGVVYRNYSNPVRLTDQTFVSGNHINLVALGGDLETGGVTAGLTFDPSSAATRTVTVTGANNDTFTLTVPTTLSASVWRNQILADQIDDPTDATFRPDRYVRNVTAVPGRNAVNVTFEANEQYELTLSRVFVHATNDDPSERRPAARYVVTADETNTKTGDDGRVKLTIEARDRYNNPVSNANVTFDANVGSFETQSGDSARDRATGNPGTTLRTNENGQATVYFNATGNLGTVPVNAYLGNDTSATGSRKVTYKVFNNVLGGSVGGGSSGEQGGRSLVVLQDVQFYPTSSGGNGTIQMTFENKGSFPINMTGTRLDYVVIYVSQGSTIVQDGPSYVDYVDLRGDVSHAGESTPIRRPYQATSGSPYAMQEARAPYFFTRNVQIDGNGTFTMTLHFDQDLNYPKNSGSSSIGFAFYLEGGLTVTVTAYDD